MKLPLIGITGGIACGKSEVARYLRNRGFYVIDGDVLGHRVLEPDRISYQRIVNCFGEKILNEDKTINRKLLGEIVFQDKEQLKILNSISHPAIEKMLREEVKKLLLKSERKTLFVEAAVLIEAGWFRLCQQIWVVILNQEVALKYLMNRNQLTLEKAKERMEAQLNENERIRHADLILDNNGTVEALIRQVEVAIKNLR